MIQMRLIFFVLLITDYLLHKEKQISAQLMDKWRKAALAVSYASVFSTFAIGVSAFGKHMFTAQHSLP